MVTFTKFTVNENINNNNHSNSSNKDTKYMI